MTRLEEILDGGGSVSPDGGDVDGPPETWLGREVGVGVPVCRMGKKPIGGCRPSWRVCWLPDDLQNSEGVSLYGPDTLQGSSVANRRPGVSGVGVPGIR